MTRKKPPKPTPPTATPAPLTVVESTRFAKQLEPQGKRGKDLSKLQPVVVALATRQPLEPKHRDHALTGDWAGYRECHVEPDWLLVYRTTDSELRLARTGTHSDLGF